MRRLLTLGVGIVIGQWLAFAGPWSPARLFEQAYEASTQALARQARDDPGGPGTELGGPGETVAVLENARGVWVTNVVVNGRHRGRFLIDTGSSVLVISPGFAQTVGAEPRGADTLELETISGRTRAAWTTLDSIRVGEAEVRRANAVVHFPGGDLDGILGNSFLSRWDASLDPDRRVLRLRRPATADEAVSASPR